MELDLNRQTSLKPEIISVEASSKAIWPATLPEAYDYLCKLDNLLPPIPNLQRLQVARQVGKARLLLSVSAVGIKMNIAIDLQVRYLPEQGRIILSSCPTMETALFGPVPQGYMPARFRTEITLGQGRTGDSVIAASLRLGLDELPNGMTISPFGGSFILNIAQSMAQERIQKIVVQLMGRLQQNFVASRAA